MKDVEYKHECMVCGKEDEYGDPGWIYINLGSGGEIGIRDNTGVTNVYLYIRKKKHLLFCSIECIHSFFVDLNVEVKRRGKLGCGLGGGSEIEDSDEEILRKEDDFIR